jgi:hypothetical protein
MFAESTDIDAVIAEMMSGLVVAQNAINRRRSDDELFQRGYDVADGDIANGNLEILEEAYEQEMWAALERNDFWAPDCYRAGWRQRINEERAQRAYQQEKAQKEQEA